MLHMRRPPALEALTIAVADGLTGGYIRAGEGFNTLVGGEAPGDFSEVSDPDDFDMTADHETASRFWDRAKLRFPDFAAATPLGGYSALYDMTPDGNPVLDASAAARGLYWAVGFSGHGFKLSPGGRAHGGRARALRREQGTPDQPLPPGPFRRRRPLLRRNTPTRDGCIPDGASRPGRLPVRSVEPEPDAGALFLEHRSDGAVPLPPAPVHRLGKLSRAQFDDPCRHPVL